MFHKNDALMNKNFNIKRNIKNEKKEKKKGKLTKSTTERFFKSFLQIR